MYFKQISDKKLSQYSYLIGSQATGEAIVIDPMRDIDQYYELAEKENLNITAAADTHIHADYVSGLREFAERGVTVYASDEGDENWKYEWLKDSSYNYKLVTGGDAFSIGNIKLDVIHTPGHTPESVSFLVTDRATADEPMGVLTGDFVFVGDVGRPDLLETAAGQKGAMKPAARALYRSIQEFKDLPGYLQVWPAHGAGSACGKAPGAVPESTVGYELRFNQAFRAAASEQQFVDFILEGQTEPPLYFSRMKTINKEGPAILGEPEKPPKVTLGEVQDQDGVIIDSRDRHEYMNSHLPGSILATFDKNFSTIAGSYVDPEEDIYLIIEEENVAQAYRDLMHVGLDNLKGFVIPFEVAAYNGEFKQVGTVDFDFIAKHHQDDNRQVLDVRSSGEYNQGHVPGALHIPHTRLADQFDEVPKDVELLVHCGSGQRASYAAGLLDSKGYQLKWVDDFYSNWQQKYAKEGK